MVPMHTWQVVTVPVCFLEASSSVRQENRVERGKRLLGITAGSGSHSGVPGAAREQATPHSAAPAGIGQKQLRGSDRRRLLECLRHDTSCRRDRGSSLVASVESLLDCAT
ncbi:hypothetical protein NDU88_005578 [Pleurodeles waltl]|uniref:Secreted protein n=1 Tax=Pleurodeles waltl TaxID=8319 RepID=A0AAV7MWQ9_PLEWA|nr:hypothetical protein NDU88_005578 [Pleurodeles waltl]